MKTDLMASDRDEAREAELMLYVADEMEAAARTRFETTLGEEQAREAADFGTLDAMLRNFAAADEPSADEYRRTRESAIRLARTRALPLIRRAAARPVRMRRLPRWSIAAAAAVVAIVGFVSWVSNAGPLTLPSASVNGVMPGGPVDEQVARRLELEQLWITDREAVLGIVSGFNAVDPSAAGETGDLDFISPEDIQSQFDALTIVSSMPVDD